jgi:hypothetical protein
LLALVGEVGDVGLKGESLPALPDDEEVDLLRISSARMSSKETLRWGWVMGTSSRFSTKREAMAIVLVVVRVDCVVG